MATSIFYILPLEDTMFPSNTDTMLLDNLSALKFYSRFNQAKICNPVFFSIYRWALIDRCFRKYYTQKFSENNMISQRKKKAEENKINNTYKVGCQIQGFSENIKENLRSQLL